MTYPRCPQCGGNLGTRDQDGELHCLLCGQRQGPPILPARLVGSRALELRPSLLREGPP